MDTVIDRPPGFAPPGGEEVVTAGDEGKEPGGGSATGKQGERFREMAAKRRGTAPVVKAAVVNPVSVATISPGGHAAIMEWALPSHRLQ